MIRIMKHELRIRSAVYIVLFAIVVLATILRLWQLGHVPPSPDWDEVALGYDAYSIIHTGRDEFGKFLPVVLRSFDDYKPALYAYLAVPTVLMFGLNVAAVRLPSAIFGVISVIAVFYLVRELFEHNPKKDFFALAASSLFAISPWSLQFSRVAFESNVGVALNILTALFFVKGLKKPWMLSLSAFFAGLCIYVYQSEKVFTPLLVLILVAVYFRKLISIPRKYLITSIVVGIIIVSPMIFYILNNRAALLRVSGTSIFSYQTEVLKNSSQRLNLDKLNSDRLGLLFDNRRLIYGITIISGYLSHFDLNWLFMTGDISRHHAPGMGMIYLFELPLILIGIYMLFFGDFDKNSKKLVFLWFLAAAIPASITTGVPHAVRTLNFLPTYQILSGIGLVAVFFWLLDLKYKISFVKVKYIISAFCILLFIFNFSYYLDQYFVQQNYYSSEDWQYGYEKAVDVVNKIGNKYSEIVVSDHQPMDKSYMFFLFYLKYPPAEYQKIGENSSGSFVSHHSFGKYTFRSIDWSQDSQRKGVLYISTKDEIPEGVGLIQEIRNLDGKPAIKIAGT